MFHLCNVHSFWLWAWQGTPPGELLLHHSLSVHWSLYMLPLWTNVCKKKYTLSRNNYQWKWVSPRFIWHIWLSFKNIIFNDYHTCNILRQQPIDIMEGVNIQIEIENIILVNCETIGHILCPVVHGIWCGSRTQTILFHLKIHLLLSKECFFCFKHTISPIQ